MAFLAYRTGCPLYAAKNYQAKAYRFFAKVFEWRHLTVKRGRYNLNASL